MAVNCTVFINGSMTGSSYTFADVPRVGDNIQISANADHLLLSVTAVTFVAKGTFPNDGGEPDVQVNASTSRT